VTLPAARAFCAARTASSWLFLQPGHIPKTVTKIPCHHLDFHDAKLALKNSPSLNFEKRSLEGHGGVYFRETGPHGLVVTMP
jgi:hypothetical protein